MIRRSSRNRGLTKTSWLESYHSFSFGDFYDADWNGQGPLKVINEDFVDLKSGFPLHHHRNMEIITLVLEGSLTHEDDLGNKILLSAGEVGLMSAGRGIRHSETNTGNGSRAHFYQIWIEPSEFDTDPSYHRYRLENKKPLLPLAGPQDFPLILKQQVEVYLLRLQPSEEFSIQGTGWIQVLKGAAETKDTSLKTGDGFYVSEPCSLTASPSFEALLFQW